MPVAVAYPSATISAAILGRAHPFTRLPATPVEPSGKLGHGWIALGI